MYDYAMRMAAVFMISTSTLLSWGGLAPRLLAVSGYVIAAVLLILVGTIAWTELLFPVWVALVSLHILRRGYPQALRPSPRSTTVTLRTAKYVAVGVLAGPRHHEHRLTRAS